MKIIDCFTFFNELDLLEFRLKFLDPHIDHFIIAESNLTHSGIAKPFYFEENKKLFEPWLHKIIYLPIKQTTAGLDFSKRETSYNPQGAAWQLEYEQRNALSAAAVVASDNDLVIVGDLDEMPNLFQLRKINLGEEPLVLSMLFHYYFFNCQNTGVERWWNGSVVASGKQFKEKTPQILRDNRNSYKRIKKAGWHFSYLGGVEKIKEKIRSFAHTEFNKEEFLEDEYLLKAISSGEDIFKRKGVAFEFVSTFYYPSRLRKLMDLYPAFIYPDAKDSFLKKIGYAVKNTFS